MRRAEYLQENSEKIRQQKRLAEQRRQVRLKEQEVRRQRERDRARAWAKAHPEEVRARQQAWVESNRERVRQQKLAYYYRHHEERKYAGRERNTARRQNPVAQAQALLYRESERDRNKARATARRTDTATREAHNRYQNEWRRRERRRIQLGLPRRLAHRPTKNERIDHERAANEFFSRHRTRTDRLGLREDGAVVRTAAYIDATHRDRTLARRAATMLAEAQRPARLNAAIDAHLASRAGIRLREEVRMDDLARRLRGAPAYLNLETELRRRAVVELEERAAAGHDNLTPRSVIDASIQIRPAKPSQSGQHVVDGGFGRDPQKTTGDIQTPLSR